MAISRGGFRALQDLRRRVEILTKAGFKGELAQVLAATATKQVADSFRKSRDPYGRPWAPLVLRRGKPLMDTGRMRNSVTAQPAPGGFRLQITAAYSPTHQYGAHIKPRRAKALTFKVRGRKGMFRLSEARIPRRQMVPEKDTGGLGPIWSAAFAKDAQALLRRKMGR